MKIARALISVSDKTGVVELARELVDLGVEVVSSGGTARALAEAGVPVTKVADVTGAPEILGGRVKTLHPKIHGGILADRHDPDHVKQIAEQGIEPFDLVVCNLYPFERAVSHPSTQEKDAIEQIDVGGPAMVRAAAKNFHSVAVVVDPSEYDGVLKEIRTDGEVSDACRRRLALQAFQHTASYDSAIAAWLSGQERFPEHLILPFHKVMDLRYGENPHQKAAFYRSTESALGLADSDQLHGKELSFNNLLDVDAAWKLACDLEEPAVAIVKHSNPCGVAAAEDLATAYRLALECDRTSAFGGIVALNATCDFDTARQIAEIFTEVIVAPAYDDEALEVLQAKKNVRILVAPQDIPPELDMRRVAGGLLLQTPDVLEGMEDIRVVTELQPEPEQWADLRFAWTVCKHVKSNAIVLAKDRVAVGVGAGQMSRVEATELAARRAGDRARGSAAASDAFFPFRDGVEAAIAAGARCIIQPGGSVRDDEVIAAANEHNVPMVFTGRRHFRH